MNKNRVEGAVKKGSGAVKEATGKAVGNRELQAKGAVEKALGTVENTLGKVRDKVSAEFRRH